MQTEHFSIFKPICPQCKQNNIEHKLLLQSAKKEGNNIIEGQLYCSQCSQIYPILHGIPILVPNPEGYIQRSYMHLMWDVTQSLFLDQWLSQGCGPQSDYELTKHYLSTYMWAHYADLKPELFNQTSNFPNIIEEMMQPCLFEGPQIDLGCSVGRGTFLLAHASKNHTLGLDVNFSMLRMAQYIKHTGHIRYRLREFGTIYRPIDFQISLPSAHLVDFWAVDALALPFADQSIIRSHSTNLIDCVSQPQKHLCELARVHNPLGYFSIVTPFDWSPSATPYDNWIGGHSPMRPLNGDPSQNLQWMLSNQSPFPELHNLEMLRTQSDISWRIRIHNRSTMHYNLHLTSVRRKNGLSSTC